MIGLLASVFGLALVDSLNPSAVAVTLYLLLARKSYASGVLAFVAGIFFVNLSVGALLMLGLGSVLGYVEGPVTYAVQGVVGAMLLAYAIFVPGDTGEETKARRPRSQSAGVVLLLGVTITFVEFSTAFPYLGAVAIMTNTNLAVVQWLSILVAYNVVFVLPPLLLMAAYWLFGSRLKPRLERYREKLSRGSRQTLLWVVGIVGFLLLADSLAYFDFFGLVEVPGYGPES